MGICLRHIRYKRGSKVKNQRYHAKVRALQHYEVKLTNLDLEKMAEIYRHSPSTIYLRKQSNRVSKAIITYNGQVYPIVYDKKRHQLITILKPEYLSPTDFREYELCVASLHSGSSKLQETTIEGLPEVVESEEPEEVLEEETMEVDDGFVELKDDDEQLMQEAFNKLNF